ncbi:hypothetical protein [Flavobacterium soli]|uniref:hypothetical protein n=1 Tax=Flavobacterium soli TaxID=344881 RepID=UPI00040032DD|nr:hypothetical protein [Flavobacterium soli]
MENLSIIVKNQLSDIDFSRNYFRNYFMTIDEKLFIHCNDLSEKYHDHIKLHLQIGMDKGIELEKIKSLYKPFSEYSNDIEKQFVQRFRYSVIIQIYSFLEAELNKICQTIHENFDVKFRLSDLKGANDIDRVKLYLLKTLNHDISKIKLWKFVNDFRKIRNLIVHSDGIFTINHNDYRSVVEFSKDNFQINEINETMVLMIDNPEFIVNSINSISRFLNHVINNKHIA